MRLSGAQHRALMDAFTDAFSEEDLAELVRYSLDVRVGDLVGDKGHRAVTRAVLDYAEQHDAVDALVMDARQLNPRNQALAKVSGALLITPDDAVILERVIPGQHRIFDPAEFRASMVDAENRVCQITVRERPQGSGFLVGPDLVLTNQHVVASVMDEAVAAIVVNFDYTAQRSAATPVGVASDWLVASSPPSPLDENPVAGQEPTTNELDYALIRLETAVGEAPVNDASSTQRGWISLRQDAALPAAATDIVIMQHPGGGPRRCAIAGFVGPNGNATRMRYLTSTEPGSSGSPCLDLDWNLIGLHHGAEPVAEASYNVGIPLAAIAASLTQTGILATLP
jgi:V8-like Glu-specific endopeptidase